MARDPFARLRDPSRPLDKLPFSVSEARERIEVVGSPADELTAISILDAPAWLREIPLTLEEGLPRVPFPAALYPPDHQRGPSRGPAVVAVKRACSRWRPDLLPWGHFDDRFNRPLERVLKELQGLAGIRPITGVYGKPTHDALRAARRAGSPNEWAFDAVAIRILVDAAAVIPARHVAEAMIRQVIASYCRVTIVYADRWHYEQYRPMRSFGVPPSVGGRSDCSEHATAARYAARERVNLPVADPNGHWFDGYGWTGDMLSHNRGRTVVGDFEVGDLALYDGHVTTCYEPGNAAVAAFCSNGSEEGPFGTRLHYRDDLIVVVRPALLA